MSNDRPKLWMVRCEAGRLYDTFIDNGVVLLGWPFVGDLNEVANKEDIAERLKGAYSEGREKTVRIHTGVLFRFLKEIEVGDEVITYHPGNRLYRYGVVKSNYVFNDSDSEIGSDYPHRHGVDWSKTDIERDKLSQKSKDGLLPSVTLFRVNEKAADEIRRIATGDESSRPASSSDALLDDDALEEEDFYERSIELIKDRINDLDWEEMQELIAGLLRSIGYKTRVSPRGPDGGKDIVASPDGFGFKEPRIIVEVKHRRGAIGRPEIDAFSGGALQSGDKGLYVSTGGFTKEAVRRAESVKPPLELMDIHRLAEEILSRYEDFDIETKEILPLKRMYWPV